MEENEECGTCRFDHNKCIICTPVKKTDTLLYFERAEQANYHRLSINVKVGGKRSKPNE